MNTADHVAETSMIGALVRGYWYDAASTLLDRTLAGDLSGNSCGSETVTPNKSALSHAQQLAAAARRVLDLDAEDFASIATGFQSTWTRRLAESSFSAAVTGTVVRALSEARWRDELRSR
jgi:hypothetical protein